MSTISQLFIGQAYAQQTRPQVESVGSLTPTGIVMSPPSLPTVDQSTLSDLDLSACKSQGKVWNTNNSNTNGACFQPCTYGYAQENDKDIDQCLAPGSQLGISCSPQQLTGGTCTRNINQTLGIRQSNDVVTPTMMVQDIVLAATGFVGTLLTVALLVMGSKYVMGGFDESTTDDLKKNIKKLLIGLLMVIGSYTVIKIIQFVARGF